MFLCFSKFYNMYLYFCGKKFQVIFVLWILFYTFLYKDQCVKLYVFHTTSKSKSDLINCVFYSH